MEKYQIETGSMPHITIHSVVGDLNLKGHELEEVIVKTSEAENLELTKNEEEISINCPSDCTIYVPHGSVVQIHSISGDASIKSLDGELSVDNVARELILRDIGAARIDQIGLDLSAKRVRGDLEVKQIGRGAIIRDVDGQFNAANIGAHLNLRDVSGGVTARAGGHVEVSLAPVSWQTYSIEAGGNINCRLTEDSTATLQLHSGAQLIRLEVPENTKTIREDSYTLALGEGGPQIILSAGGTLALRSRSTGWETFGSYDAEFNIDAEELDNLAEEIESQVTSQIDAFTDQIDSYLDNINSNLGQDMSEEQRRRVAERLRRTQEKAQRASERAQRKIELKMQATQRKMEQRARRERRGYTPPSQPGAPAPPSPAQRFVWPLGSASTAEEAGEFVSEEERLLILTMLEESKITAEEAEQLLAALEGREE
jgi:hypothetical protein